MTSQRPSSLQQRQGFHRRQNSSPSSSLACEAMKVQYPTTVQTTNSQHRRGQSFDSRSPIRRQPQRPGSTVSVANIGSRTPGQQILREAQQQRLARPGQQPQELPGSPLCGIFQSMSNSSMTENLYDNTPTNSTTHAASCVPKHAQYHPQDSLLHMAAGLPMAIEPDENNTYAFNNVQHIFAHAGGPNSTTDRRLSHPELRVHTGLRPLTPTHQIQPVQLPLTPAATPYHGHYARLVSQSPTAHSYDGYISSPKPISMQKSRSLQGIAEHDDKNSSTPLFEVADMPILDDSAPDPIKKAMRPQSPLNHLKVDLNNHLGDNVKEEALPFFDETGGEILGLNDDVPVLESSKPPDGSQSPSRLALSPRRMSISDLNLDPGISASIEETNISLDDIAQFIEGPDPSDNKWICRYDDCNKKFGRKENIKSHVQTHLGDRQFRCDHCNKKFVRGHDLKRHAKIHTGTKPYPCLCGNAFARHDALTRHRQRGMCIGAFDGIVKKVIKRGRPRKHRPEMDERLDKASKTRRNQYQTDFDQYASSASSCSLSSWGSPLNETMDTLSIRGQSPYDDVGLFGVPPGHETSRGDSIALPPGMFSFTPPASPGYSTGNRPSPYYRELTPTDIASIAGDINCSIVTTAGQPMPSIPELAPVDQGTNQVLHANPMIIQHSQQSLPSLSHSSSSPAADVVAFDFGSDDPTLGADAGLDLGLNDMKMSLMGNHERNDFDSFLEYANMDMTLEGSGADNFFAM